MHTFSPAVHVLLGYAKADGPRDWRSVAGALRPHYGFELRLQDVLRITQQAHEALFADPRFEVGDVVRARREVLLAPLEGPYALGPLHTAPAADAQVRVETACEAMLHQMLSSFTVARVDWLQALADANDS